MSIATELFHKIVPPTKTGMHVVQSTATGAAAASFDWTTGLGADAPKGKVMLTLEATAQDVYVRFGPTSTTATTTANGGIIKVGIPRTFYVDPVDHRYIDHIAGGVGTLKVQVASPIGERRYV
jgi:hypothetical protein